MTSLSPLILLGLYREAERQFKSSIKDQDMVVTHLDLCKVYLRLDIPQDRFEASRRCQVSFKRILYEYWV